VILVDANLLIFAYDTVSPHHKAARQWLEAIFSGHQPVRIAWITILAFLRVVTNHRLYAIPLTMPEAISIVDSWFAEPNFALLPPGGQHWQILSKLLPESQARGPLVMDADLAALAIEHGATIYSHDRDFMRFPGLKFVNPLAPAKS
jgi:toxin-antitoxin system PIN domain toxin